MACKLLFAASWSMDWCHGVPKAYGQGSSCLAAQHCLFEMKLQYASRESSEKSSLQKQSNLVLFSSQLKQDFIPPVCSLKHTEAY